MRTSRKRGSWTLQLVDDVRVAKSVLEINDLTALILANGMSGKGLNWNHRQNRIRARIGGLFIIAVAVIVVGVVISAKVRYLVELEPPAQYNHPYDGPIDERVMSVSEVRKLCTSLGASARGVACSWISDGVCHIILPNDEPAPVDTYRQHEIAHCNGWPANHPPG